MVGATWIVQHGLAAASIRAPLRFAAPLYDVLSIGPQHVDATLERLLRAAAGMPSDLDALDEHAALLGDDVVLLAHRELGAALAALWWIDVMTQRGADVRHVRLAIAPRSAGASAVARAIREAAPIGDDLDPLCALRRALATDDDALSLPIDDISAPRRAWASVIARVRDLLPDPRGLDLADARLLEHTGADWTSAVEIVAFAIAAARDDEHHVGDGTLWARLRALAEQRPAKHPRDARDDDEPTPLVELDLRGALEPRHARARLTPLGAQVLAGRDALEIRAFDRWVGARFLTRDRIRRTGLRRA